MIYGYDFLRRRTEGEGYYDSNGDWVTSDGEWGEPIECDVEHPTSGKADVLRDEAGNVIEYSYIVWLNTSVQPFQIGNHILLSTGDGAEAEYVVKGYRKFRTMAKLWV